jgi:competence protein ComEC
VRSPAVLPTFALAAGIAVGIFLYPRPVSHTFFLLSATLGWFGAASALARRWVRVFLAVTAVNYVLLGIALGAKANDEAVHAPLGTLFDRHVAPGEYQLFATIEGTLRADAAMGPSGVSLSLDVDRIVFDGGHRTTSGGALIGVGGALAPGRISQWRAGRRVRMPAMLRRPAVYLDPGVGDSVRALAWKGTSLVGSTKSGGLIEVLARGSPLSEALAAGRAAVRDAIDLTVAPWSARSSSVVTAILIGDRAGLDEEMQRQLQEAGTYHVIAISGGNIAILAGLCVALLRACRCGPQASAVVTIFILAVYALVIGGGSSVLRATLMAAIYFAGRAADQRGSPVNIAAVSAAVLFYFAPLEIVDAGFALTFGATIGLLVGMPTVWRARRGPRWISAGAALLAASVCVEIALLPVSAFIFSRVTAAGLLLNFAAVPLMTLVQTTGMAAVALVQVSPRGALWAGYAAHLGVRGILASAALVDRWPLMGRMVVRVPPPSLWLMAAYYGALALTLMVRARRGRAICAAVVVACGWWIVAAPAFSFPTALIDGFTRSTEGRALLRVTFLDVGQGDAAVVQFPGGRTMSIDAGGAAGGTFDIGSRVVSPAFWALGVRRLDYLSLSHGDPDHIGGAGALLRDFHPAEVWEGVPVPPHELTNRLKALAARAGVPWRTLQAGDALSIGDVRLTVHHPPPPDWERQKVRNDDSEVLEIRYGGVSVVFTGDIGGDVERSIAASFDRAPIRILKAPHHGSASSSSMDFLRALNPAVAVVSAGRGNPFGHPAPLVLDRYRAIDAAVYRTDLDGAVTVETDGTTVSLRTFTNRRLTLRAR